MVGYFDHVQSSTVLMRNFILRTRTLARGRRSFGAMDLNAVVLSAVNFNAAF